jgi:hypothetical protein
MMAAAWFARRTVAAMGVASVGLLFLRAGSPTLNVRCLIRLRTAKLLTRLK